jgi:hypothetical protein
MLKKAEGKPELIRGQKAKGFVQNGIQTPPEGEPMNKVHSWFDTLTQARVMGSCQRHS